MFIGKKAVNNYITKQFTAAMNWTALVNVIKSTHRVRWSIMHNSICD